MGGCLSKCSNRRAPENLDRELPESEAGLNAVEQQPEACPNAEAQQPEAGPYAVESQPEAVSITAERQPEASPNAEEQQPEAGPNAKESQPEAVSITGERQPEADPNAEEQQPEAGPNAVESQPEAVSITAERQPEAGPNAEEQQPEAGSNAVESQPEAVSITGERQTEAGPNAEEQQPEAGPNAVESQPEAVCITAEQQPEASPNAEERQPEAGLNAEEPQPEGELCLEADAENKEAQLVSPDLGSDDDESEDHELHVEPEFEGNITPVDIEETMWIIGPGISGDQPVRVKSEADGKLKEFVAKYQEKGQTLQDETENKKVTTFLSEFRKAIINLSPENKTEQRNKLKEYLKRQSTLNQGIAEDLAMEEGEQLDPSICEVVKSWREASGELLNSNLRKDKIFGLLQGESNTVAQGCLIAKFLDIPNAYKNLKLNWTTRDNWESQIKESLKMAISEQTKQTVQKVQSSEFRESLEEVQRDGEKDLIDSFVEHTSIYVVGNVGDFLDDSSKSYSGFLMFTTDWEIRDEFKNLIKVDTDRLLTAIDQTNRSVNSTALQALREDENATKSTSKSKRTTIWKFNSDNITEVISRRDQSGLNLIENIIVYKPTYGEITLDQIWRDVSSQRRAELFTDAIIHLTSSGYKAVTFEPLVTRMSKDDIMQILKSLFSREHTVLYEKRTGLEILLDNNSWAVEEVLKQLLNKVEDADTLMSLLTEQSSKTLCEILKTDILRNSLTSKLSQEQYLTVLSSADFTALSEDKSLCYPYWKVLQPLSEDRTRILLRQINFVNNWKHKDQTKAFLLYNRYEDELYDLLDIIPEYFDYFDLKAGILLYLVHTMSHLTNNQYVEYWKGRFRNSYFGDVTAQTQLPSCCDGTKLNIIERAVFWMCSCIATSQNTETSLLQSALTPSTGEFSRYILRFIVGTDETIISRYMENTDTLLSEVCSQYDVCEQRQLISACIQGDSSKILSILLDQITHQRKFAQVCLAKELNPLLDAIKCESKQSFNTIITFFKKTENKDEAMALIELDSGVLNLAVQANDPEYVRSLLSTIIMNQSFEAVHRVVRGTRLLSKAVEEENSSTLEEILQFYSDKLDQYIELLTHYMPIIAPLHEAARPMNSVYLDILLGRLKGHTGIIHELCMKQCQGFAVLHDRNVLQTAILFESGAFRTIMKSYKNEQQLLKLVEKQDGSGNSSLHYAASAPTTVYLNVLLARCGKSDELNRILSLKNQENLTALSVALENKEFTNWEKFQFVKEMKSPEN